MSEPTGAAPAAPSAPADTSGAVQGDNSASNVASQPQAVNAGGESAQAVAIQEAVDNGEISQAEANKLIKKLEIKVRGKTMTKEIDFNDEDALRNLAQLAEVSKLSMQEKAELERRFEQILQQGKQDPMDFIAKAFGIDPDELAAMHIEKKIEHMKKSPEVLAKEQMEAELKELREQAKKMQEEKEMAELSKLQQEQLTSLQSEISDAIKTQTKLPDTKYVQQKFANAMLWAANNGFEDVTAADIAEVVEQEMRQELNSLYDAMPEDVLENYVGRKNIERLRKSKIAKAKEVPSVNQVKPTANVEPKKSLEQQKIDAKKFWRGR